jgi:AraC-like DNA-binding protein
MATAMSTYRELPPPAAMAAFVECVWEQRIGDVDRPYEQPVFPDGSIDLVADEHGAFVAGPATRPVVVTMPSRSITVGVRLRRGAAPAILDAGAQNLVDLNVSFDDLWGREGAATAGRIGDQSPDRRLPTLLDFVSARLDRKAEVDREVAAATALLEAQPPHSVDDLCDATNLSARQLRRRVAEAVGYSPRLLGGILRFQRFLRVARATPPDDRDLARLAVEVGYADQPHLTRECHRFSGLSPAALFADEARRLGATDTDARPERSRRPAGP